MQKSDVYHLLPTYHVYMEVSRVLGIRVFTTVWGWALKLWFPFISPWAAKLSPKLHLIFQNSYGTWHKHDFATGHSPTQTQTLSPPPHTHTHTHTRTHTHKIQHPVDIFFLYEKWQKWEIQTALRGHTMLQMLRINVWKKYTGKHLNSLTKAVPAEQFSNILLAYRWVR